MSRPGKRWYHFVINTKGTWLHGDPRGFRNRAHRIHSSGDYKNPPPRGEHANLHTYMKQSSGAEVTIPRELRPIIGQEFVKYLIKDGHRITTFAVAKIHAHGLAELPRTLRQVRLIIGEAKRASSRAVRAQLPGSIWAAGLQPTCVNSDDHMRRANDYILYEQGAGAWTWSFHDGSLDGAFNRKRKPKNLGRR